MRTGLDAKHMSQGVLRLRDAVRTRVGGWLGAPSGDHGRTEEMLEKTDVASAWGSARSESPLKPEVEAVSACHF